MQKQLKTCRTCRDKKNKRNTPSETQETETSQPPSDDEPPRIIPTFTSENQYSNMSLCRPDFLMPSPERPGQSIKQLLTHIHEILTNKSSNTCANDMLNDISKRLTVIETITFVREFIEYQKQQNQEMTRLLNLIHSAID